MAVLAKVNEYKGKQDLYEIRKSEKLESMRQDATIQSADYSSRIEGINVPKERLEPLLEKSSEPANRNEGEVLGYKMVLKDIHNNHSQMRLNAVLIRKFHKVLMRSSPDAGGGEWKTDKNYVTEKTLGGGERVRTRTVAPDQVPQEIDKLNEGFHRMWNDSGKDKLVLIAAYILDFLRIHPFTDGNGRTARLLALLLLYRGGFRVGRFISLERIIENTKKSYYKALKDGDDGWEEGKHNIIPWVNYFSRTLLMAYGELEEGVVTFSNKEKVINTIENLPAVFRSMDVLDRCKIPEQTVRNILSGLKKEGKIQLIGKGRGAKWQKV